jgi:hypothetical protein
LLGLDRFPLWDLARWPIAIVYADRCVAVWSKSSGDTICGAGPSR